MNNKPKFECFGCGRYFSAEEFRLENNEIIICKDCWGDTECVLNPWGDYEQFIPESDKAIIKAQEALTKLIKFSTNLHEQFLAAMRHIQYDNHAMSFNHGPNWRSEFIASVIKKLES